MVGVDRQSSWELRNNLRKFSGQVLHVVRDNSLLRYRVDDSGRILHEKVEQVQRKWRSVVTGDPEKKVRDYMHEVPQVKFIDKLSFLFGVTSIAFSEFLVLRYPTYFTQFYYILMAILMVNRYYQYKEEKMTYFLIDLCYFMNVSVILQTAFFPNALTWYKTNYVLCMGCLMLAIIIWQNSLVFHSLDKLTSFFLHAMPPLTLHLYRWELIPSELFSEDPTDKMLTWTDTFFWPMVMYWTWQLGFTYLIEYPFADNLLKDQELMYSVRYLVRDKKNGMNIIVTKICKYVGIMKKDEKLDSDSAKTKITFAISQFVVTLFTLVITPVCYSNYYFSFVYIVSIYMWCIWRGGAYYIEVFSERYKLKFTTEDYKDTKDKSEYEVGLDDPELYSQIYAALSQEESKQTSNGVKMSSRSEVHISHHQKTQVTRQVLTNRKKNNSTSSRQQSLSDGLEVTEVEFEDDHSSSTSSSDV